ncbi:DinB family protein [uncultured Flavobacterium sp.]|uniref:DinB family protein n=1 Tax=uncultured Flavobacterium sp. TaxID=165435 RepID=UPI0030EDC368|tara:strand:+ start:99358 stop:99867 length:510 start_codon:yes stop_codon:yes gene_type:complete
MKKAILLFILLFSSVGFSQNETIEVFLEKWKNSKTYLVEIAKAMPEENYSYKPTAREMSFGEQLLHIKGNMDWLGTTYFTSEKFDKKKDEKTYSKDEIISMLEMSFDKVYEVIKNTKSENLKDKVEFFAGPKTKLQILNLLQDHVTHHRGQLIVYLNLNEIKPPSYVGW